MDLSITSQVNLISRYSDVLQTSKNRHECQSTEDRWDRLQHPL